MNDTEKYTGGWTLISLYKHFTSRFKDFNLAFKEFRSTVNRDAIKQNEFRRSLDDLGQKMQTKSEARALQKSNDDKLAEFGKQIAELRSRLDVGSPAVAALQSRQDNQEGQRKGEEITMGKIYAAIGAATAIIGALMYIN